MRFVLYPFLAALLYCGLFSVEMWPMTAWRLFSGLRTPDQRGWTAVRVLPDGREAAIDFAALGRGYTGALHLMIEFPGRTDSERQDVCAVWRSALHRAAVPAAGVRVYRTRSVLSTNTSTRTVERVLFYEC